MAQRAFLLQVIADTLFHACIEAFLQPLAIPRGAIGWSAQRKIGAVRRDQGIVRARQAGMHGVAWRIRLGNRRTRCGISMQARPGIRRDSLSEKLAIQTDIYSGPLFR